MKRPYQTPTLKQTANLSTRHPYSPAKSEYENAPAHFVDVVSSYPAPLEAKRVVDVPSAYPAAEHVRWSLAACPACDHDKHLCKPCTARLETIMAEMDEGKRQSFDPEFMLLTERSLSYNIARREDADRSRLYLTTTIVAIITFALTLITALYFRG